VGVNGRAKQKIIREIRVHPRPNYKPYLGNVITGKPPI
jgi:hypothetical protein